MDIVTSKKPSQVSSLSLPKSVRDPLWVRLLLTVLALAFLLFFLITPLVVVVVSAFREGWPIFVRSILDPETLSAVRLTLLAVGVAVPLNVIFGVSAAWAVTKFEFRFKNLLITLIDLPFTVSPVIAGMIFVLLFGSRSPVGAWMIDHGFKVIYGVPGIILATIFVTFPFVARELIPLMQSQGSEQEEAALTLGANGWQIFSMITLPNIRWGLLYGVILCTARGLGEFGAVSVVSGHIRGVTNTISLQVEILYNEYQFSAAFAVASLLVLASFVTLFLKWYAEKKLG